MAHHLFLCENSLHLPDTGDLLNPLLVSGVKQRTGVQTDGGTVITDVISTAENHPTIDKLQAALGHITTVTI